MNADNIKMIYKGSYDTYISGYIKIENAFFKIVIIIHNITVLTIFDQINAFLVNIRDFF